MRNGKAINSVVAVLLLSSGAIWTGCSGSSEPGDPCAGVDCSGHGTCASDGTTASCTCDTGYHAEGLACVIDDVDACEGVTCSGHGTCSENEFGNPTCTCEEGYKPAGTQCVDDTDPCKDVLCGGHGTCAVDANNDPYCTCDEGYHVEGLDCVVNPNPCEGITCSGHGTCTPNLEGNPECACDGGYHPVGLDCVSDVNPCDGVTCCGHGTCSAPADVAQCDCDAGFHVNVDTSTVCSPDRPGSYPPGIEDLFNGTFTGGNCTLPACDATCGEPGFDAVSTWDMALTFKKEEEDARTTCSNALVAVAVSQLTDPIELNMNFHGNCMVNSDGVHIGTAYEGVVTLCRADTVSSFDIAVWETGLATCTGNTGAGSAIVYMRDIFNLFKDCTIYADATVTKR